jgi:small subunit ribosomal protein S7
MRKAKPKKRIILPDPKFNDSLVTKFVNNLMLQGKKNLSYQIFYDAVEIVSTKLNEDGLEVWKKALANVTPSVEVRSRRIGGATFQIPSEIRPDRKMSIGMKNMIKYARKRSEKTMANKLAAEIMSGYREEGAAFKKKEETHRMAEANKAFSHFRF